MLCRRVMSFSNDQGDDYQIDVVHNHDDIKNDSTP